MFLKKYKQLKSLFKEENLYENKSFGNGDLFCFEEMEKEVDEIYLTASEIESFYSELEVTKLKYDFVKSFLENEFARLERENKRLDEEYFKLNNIESRTGNSFLKMMKLGNTNNHIVDNSISYMRNVKVIGDKAYSNNEKSSEVQFYIEYQSEYNIFAVFEKMVKINECVIEFHKDVEYSVFGVTEDDTMKNIFTNINSKENSFLLINEEEKFKKLFIISNQNTKNVLKNARFFTTEETTETRASLICYKVDGLSSLEKIEFSSTSAGKLYIFDTKEYKSFLKDVAEDEENGIFKHLNERRRIEKNIQIDTEKYNNSMFLVEHFEADQRMADIINFYGVEK